MSGVDFPKFLGSGLVASMAVRRAGVRDAVVAEVDQLPAGVRKSALAAAVVTLAELIPESSPRDAAALVRELRQSMAELRGLAAEAPAEKEDPVDEVARRRAARHATAVSAHADGGVERG